MATTLEQLTKQLEQVIHEHMAETQLAATRAVTQAFVARILRERGSTKSPRSPGNAHRSSEEINALSEKLYEVVCKQPGEAMAVFAAKLSSTANELQMPMRRLRNEGRVRSIGERHQTRYFPL